MVFQIWSPLHITIIAMPIVLVALLYLLLRKKSEKTRYIIGVVIGVISLGILLLRNIYLVIELKGFHPEIIPLQVCHFGNIMVFIALVFKNKTAAAIAWCLNLIPAYGSVIDAEAIHNGLFWDVMVQTYLWGHFFIAFGALYIVVLKIVRFGFKDFLRGIPIIFVLMIAAIIMNSVFRDIQGIWINYFFMYDSGGVPFEMFFALGKMVKIGNWFTFNPIYILCLIALGLVVMPIMFLLAQLFFRKRRPRPNIPEQVMIS